MSLGILNITLLKATQVEDFDYVGNSDPYIVVIIKDRVQKTFVANLNEFNDALWNEKIVFEIKNPSDLSKLTFQLWDKDQFGSDDLILEMDVHPEELGFVVNKEKLTIEITKSERGNLHYVLHYVPMTMMQKMYEKLNNAAEQFKQKLISQIVTFVSDRVL